jgi:hypothetical protein
MAKEKINPQIDITSLIHLLKVEITSFNVSDNSGKIRKEDVKSFNFNFSFLIKITLEDDIAIFSSRIDFRFSNDKDIYLEGGSANLSARFDFKIKDLKNFVEENPENKVLNMKPNLAATVVGIMYSTLRGILIVKAQDTILEKITLPVLNPFQIINPPIIIN